MVEISIIAIITLCIIVVSLVVYFTAFYKKNKDSCSDDSDCDKDTLHFCIENKCVKFDCLVDTDCKVHQICDKKGSHTCLCDSYSYKKNAKETIIKKYIGKDCQYSDVTDCSSNGIVDENGKCDCYVYHSLADTSDKKRVGDHCQYSDNDTCKPDLNHPNYGIVDKDGKCVYPEPECNTNIDCGNINKTCDLKTRKCICNAYKSLADSVLKRRLGDQCQYSDNDTCKPSTTKNYGVVNENGQCDYCSTYDNNCTTCKVGRGPENDCSKYKYIRGKFMTKNCHMIGGDNDQLSCKREFGVNSQITDAGYCKNDALCPGGSNDRVICVTDGAFYSSDQTLHNNYDFDRGQNYNEIPTVWPADLFVE